jgi:hypothetical protein
MQYSATLHLLSQTTIGMEMSISLESKDSTTTVLSLFSNKRAVSIHYDIFWVEVLKRIPALFYRGGKILMSILKAQMSHRRWMACCSIIGRNFSCFSIVCYH